MITVEIHKNDGGQRLDKFLQKAFPNLPPSIMYKGIRTKKIKVNRKRCEQNQVLSEGDTLQIFLPPEFFEKKEAENAFMKLQSHIDVLYEDEHILLVNKKPGMIVHSDEKQESGTLIDHIKAYLMEKGEYDPQNEQSFTPSLCNRIDRNTGGIVLAAKDAASLRILNEQIKLGGINKRYLAAAHGIFEKKHDVLHGYLIKNQNDNLVKVYDHKPKFGEPKEIITEYRVLSEKNGLSLVEVTLHTGRTHQIRAHLAHIGHPLFGDGKYGNNSEDRKMGYKSQALYAFHVGFDFTGDGELLSYLKGKTVEVEKKDIPFLSLFRDI